MRERAVQLREAAERRHDVIVIGGGINGAGIARDAARRGLRVLLLEKDDWGFGTTWRSTKLIHGGLRYLEHGEVPLVFESLRDRAALLRTAPHLVEPLPFLLPVYRDGSRPLPILRAGLTLYDLLATGGGLPWHRVLDAEETLRAEPRLRRDGLRGALAYWDCQVALPERLCLENVLSAHEDGAITLSRMEATRVDAARGGVATVSATDRADGGAYQFRAGAVVNAAGPWVDRVLRGARLPTGRIGGTRGSHLVIRFPSGGPRRPIYAEAPRDRRPFFILPWRGVHLAGTTDVRANDPEETLPTDDELAYLCEAVSTALPGEPLGSGDIWYAYGGIRPLPRTEDEVEGAISRRHHIIDHRDDGCGGFLSIVGGKLSTYRSLAEQVTDRLVEMLGRPALPCATRQAPLVPGAWRPLHGDRGAARLWRIYGARAVELMRALEEKPGSAAPLCAHTCETEVQVLHAVRYEGALTVGDVLLRRTPAGWSSCMGLDAAPRVAALMAEVLGWDGEAQKRAVAVYEREAATTFRRLR